MLEISTTSTTSQWLMIAIFIATFIGLVRFHRVPERVFSIAILATLITNMATTEQVLANAINPGLVTLLLLVLCSFALERTSLLRKISSHLFNGSKISAGLKTLSLTAIASAFLNNTAVVATLLNTVKGNKLINPGKLLIPLSYAAILGGTLTLVGTSTNLIVNSLFIEANQQSLGFFDFISVGIVALIACLIVIFLRMKSLPPMAAIDFAAQQYIVEAEVKSDSRLIGRTVEENGLRNLDNLFLVEVVRKGRLISPVTPDEVLEANDKLIFSGDVSKVLTLNQFDGLTLFAQIDGLLRDNLTEVMIKPGSAVVGKTLKSAGFRARFDAAVVALRRDGGAISGKLGDVVIKAGDILVLAVGQDFSSRTNLTKNFYILSDNQPDNMLHGWRNVLTVGGFILSIGISVVTGISLISTLMFYLAALIFSNSLTVNEVKRRFPLEIWMIVLGALTLADGIENSGIAYMIAQNVETVLQHQSILLAFVIIFFVTVLLTELITNNAAAALVFPIAYNVALGLGVSPMPFIMAVAFGASASFMSPYGYQTNVMVYNAGNYKFMDFVKFGIPVSIVYSIAVLIMIPVIFPF